MNDDTVSIICQSIAFFFSIALFVFQIITCVICFNQIEVMMVIVAFALGFIICLLGNVLKNSKFKSQKIEKEITVISQSETDL